jgi:hypothetical protein
MQTLTFEKFAHRFDGLNLAPQKPEKSKFPNGEGSLNEIVIFSVGCRSAVSIPGEESPTLAKKLPLHGRNPGSSLLSMEGLMSRSPPGEAFWSFGAAGGQLAAGAEIGFWIFRLLSARWPGVPLASLGLASCCSQVKFSEDTNCTN